MNPRIAALEKLVGGPRDGALLRFSLGNEYLKAGALEQAAAAFQAAVEQDPNYSAAWKALGNALSKTGRQSQALAAYKSGNSIAQARGDIQAAKEMSVFANRLAKNSTDGFQD